jgi:hydrogenase nickel incorporation protein HypB
MPRIMTVQNMLAANETIAGGIRRTLSTLQLRTLNLVGSPGAGKTTLLERSIERLREKLTLGVIAGDSATSMDAARIEAVGAQAVQVNTQGTSHLEAYMVLEALEKLDLAHIDVLVIENVGDLICPAAWNIGEDQRVVVMNIADGDETPAKYPELFATAQGVVLNKLDLLPHVEYDLEKVRRLLGKINPLLHIFEVSCWTGDGLDAWCEWLVGFAHGEMGPASLLALA